jgi:hypothetical protein
MSVTLRFITLIIPFKVLREKFPGGVDGFLIEYHDRIGKNLSFDHQLIAISAMGPQDIEAHVTRLKSAGVIPTRTSLTGEEWADIYIEGGNQYFPCSWIDGSEVGNPVWLAADSETSESQLTEKELQSALRHLHRVIEQDNFDPKNNWALRILKELSDGKHHGAMHLFGYLLWSGIGVKKNLDEAFSLISVAANSGHSPTMVSLGSMFHTGAGCERNFELACHWYKKREETWSELFAFNDVTLRRVGLTEHEFRHEYDLEINGTRYVAPITLLERLNDWLLSSKIRVIEKQTAMLERKPNCFGGISKNNLPYKMGGAHLILAGKDSITHIGWKRGWINEEFWVELSDFDSSCSGETTFGTLQSLNFTENGYVSKISMEDTEAIRNAYLSKDKQGPTVAMRRFFQKIGLLPKEREHQDILELHLSNSPVGSGVTLKYRNGSDLYSVFND